MAVFTVDSDAILAQSAAVRGTVDRLHAESQAMLTQLTQLQSSWTGQAASSFHLVVDQWRATQRQVEETLGAITQSLSAAGQQYADTEMAAQSLFLR